MDCLEPSAEPDVAIFKDGADLDGELLAARLALPNALANGTLRLRFGGELVRAFRVAVRTNHAVRPAHLFKQLSSTIFVAEVLRYALEG